MKEAIVFEKRILAIENKNAPKERKSKKVTFRDESKKKVTNDPYDMEGLQKVLKTMSNEMVEIKKKVVESSPKISFRIFKRNQPENSQPPNTISNAESDLGDDDDEEADTTLLAEEIKEEETVECHECGTLFYPTLIMKVNRKPYQ